MRNDSTADSIRVEKAGLALVMLFICGVAILAPPESRRASQAASIGLVKRSAELRHSRTATEPDEPPPPR